jgi:NAD(P)-dependent dehydrogenase (short-subunit alcohol dehydrogenase family)
MTHGTTQDDATPDLTGATAIVTGATGGVGLEIARGLSKLGATVVLGVRDVARGVAVADELGHSATAMHLDVASVASIRSFVAEYERRFDGLQILVNNAGAWFSDRRESVDGHELTFATNVLGPYLLTELLTDALVAGERARVINIVSSLAGDYDAMDLAYSRRKFDGFKAYAQSKQALRMLTWGAATRLQGKGVTVNAAAPGFVRSNFNRNATGFTSTMIRVMSRLFAVTPAKGAHTPLWVATAPELEGVTGEYFDGGKQKDGKFRDPAAIADLEARCAALIAIRRAA